MNIQEAKEEIKDAMTAYFTKDEFGRYVIAPEEQRPVFLMGPPGIGKTAIMKQVAQELGVGLLSYSMTHHTRQSALGLPFIVDKEFGGKTYSVSEYTMSEIIASVYELMEASGVTEGILFLDEINCVSETLSPVMLQFLQYKVFGRHRVPDGWIVVTAGNPPEYNDSVREFDVVTWDRLKRIDVEPSYEAWRNYAVSKSVHPAVLSYLDAKKDDFYQVETAMGGKRFVTARGWDDLSTMIRLYEQNGLVVRERLIGQYLQSLRIAKDFAVYYDLFCKYRSDYQVDKILGGQASEAIIERAKAARFDERLALVGLLLDSLDSQFNQIALQEGALKALLEALGRVRNDMASMALMPMMAIDEEVARQERMLEALTAASGRQDAAERIGLRVIGLLQDQKALVADQYDPNAAFKLLKGDYDREKAELAQLADAAGKQLSNLFGFCEAAFGEGQEMLIVVTQLTSSPQASRFIAKYGCEEYFAHNKELLFYERHMEILKDMEELDLD